MGACEELKFLALLVPKAKYLHFYNNNLNVDLPWRSSITKKLKDP